MSSGEPLTGDGPPHQAPTALPPGELLDLLSVSAVVLDDSGRIVFWSPQASEVFGYTAQEALGRYAAKLLIQQEHRDLVVKLFSEVMATGTSWAGAFPIRHKDGSVRLVEFRNMRLLDDRGDVYALGIAADQAKLQQVENELALSDHLVSQSPSGSLSWTPTCATFWSTLPSSASTASPPWTTSAAGRRTFSRFWTSTPSSPHCAAY